MQIRILLTSILSMTLMSTAALAADYYKWTDENGVTHYSARKPTDYAAEVIRINASGRGPSPEATSPPAATGTPPETGSSSAAQAAPQKDEERCNWARTTLETLRNSNRVRIREDDGEVRILSEEEKSEQRQLAEEALKDAC